MSEIKKHLETLVGITSGEQNKFYKWLLKNGTLFTAKDFLEQESEKYGEDIQAVLKECYRNSHLLQEWTGLSYYEGFYYFKDVGLVTEHGFNVKDGKVIDITSILLKFEKPVEWFGVEVFIDENTEYYGNGMQREYKKQIKT